MTTGTLPESELEAGPDRVKRTKRPASSGWNRLFRTSLVLIPLGILGNVVFTFLATDRAILASLGRYPVGYLLLALALGFVPWATVGLRLLLWTDFIGHRLSLRDAFAISLGDTLGAALTPTVVGGGAAKWGMMVHRGITAGAAASIATVAVVEDAVFFALAVPLSIWLTRAWELPVFGLLGRELGDHLPVIVALLVGIAAAGWLGLRLFRTLRRQPPAEPEEEGFWHRSGRRLRAVWRDGVDVYDLIIRRGKTRFAAGVLLAGVQWSARYSVITALVYFLGIPVDPILFFLFQWVVFTLMIFIPTPGAVGGAEAAFYLVYSALLPGQVLGIATAGWRFFTFYCQLGAAALLFSALHLKPGGAVKR
ncbi:MAG: lysylphosphatidylglycerol synthase transmembrane domain-containing protein [Longimicrobiaceae bacterium]